MFDGLLCGATAAVSVQTPPAEIEELSLDRSTSLDDIQALGPNIWFKLEGVWNHPSRARRFTSCSMVALSLHVVLTIPALLILV